MPELYKPLTEADYQALGGSWAIVRGRAIERGEAFEFNGWGPEMAARVRVLPKPKVVTPPKHPIAEADWEKLAMDDRLSRSHAIKDGRAWKPKGYDAALTARVAVPGK